MKTKKELVLNGQDKIVGRPIRLNKHTLKVKENKDYTEMVFLGDLHFGSPQFAEKKFLDMLDYCKQKEVYILLMGDLLECATRDSIGAGVYEQINTPQEQYEWMVEKLNPVKHLILGTHLGNHEDRIYQKSGYNVMKAFAKELGVPYLGDACWTELRVGSQRYTLYTLHGRTGAQRSGTVLTALENISASFDADIVAIGHAHRCVDSYELVQYVDTKSKSIKEKKKVLIVTGHYLEYEKGYWQTKGGKISKLGSPKVKLFSNKKDIHVSW